MGKGKNQDTRENAIIEITKETVQNKIITKVTAAKKMGITVAEFDKLCEEYSFGK